MDFPNETKKPTCMIADDSYLVLLFANKIKVYGCKNGHLNGNLLKAIDFSQRKASNMHTTHQKFTQLRYPRLLSASLTIFQIWDLEQEALLYEGFNLLRISLFE